MYIKLADLPELGSRGKTPMCFYKIVHVHIYSGFCHHTTTIFIYKLTEEVGNLYYRLCLKIVHHF